MGTFGIVLSQGEITQLASLQKCLASVLLHQLDRAILAEIAYPNTDAAFIHPRVSSLDRYNGIFGAQYLLLVCVERVQDRLLHGDLDRYNLIVDRRSEWPSGGSGLGSDSSANCDDSFAQRLIEICVNE